MIPLTLEGNAKKIYFAILLALCSLTGFESTGFAEEVEEVQLYPNPGIVAFREGKWVGSDHLYNISNQIEIVVEIFKPGKIHVPVTEETLRDRIVEIFKKENLQPFADAEPGQPPLPFLHMLIMLTPIEKGYAVYCEGRLFEKVTLDRVKLSEQTVFQAITWESSNLIITPTDKLSDQVNSCVDEIVGSFVERYRFFENIRSQIQQK